MDITGKLKRIILCSAIILFLPAVPDSIAVEATIAEGAGSENYPLLDGLSTEATDLSSTQTPEIEELDLGDYLQTMEVGQKQLLSVTVLPAGNEDAHVDYSSSDKSVATINGMGRITALSEGKTRITVSTGTVTEGFELTVTGVKEEDAFTAVTGIDIAHHEEKLKVGESMMLSATVRPSSASDVQINYRSSDEQIATVSGSGEVEGLRPGRVTITVSAGEVLSRTELEVVVATTAITLNRNYIVLKPGQSTAITADVLPSDAPQMVRYKASDSSVAVVSADGVVSAKKPGDTSVIISNGDISVAVTVIVNAEDTVDENTLLQQETAVPIANADMYSDLLYASSQSLVDEAFLKFLYLERRALEVVGDGYKLILAGTDIVNYQNELLTDIALKRDKGQVSFELNGGKPLCGDVTVSFEDMDGRYLYLYNNSKKKYELIQTDDLRLLKLSRGGKYLITQEKLGTWNPLWLWLAGGFAVALGAGVAGYVVVKKKYWFW